MLIPILFLGLVAFSHCVPTVKETIVQDWLTVNTNVQIVSSASTGYISPRGTLQHVNTGKNIRPEGLDCPRKNHWLKIGNTDFEEKMKFRWVQQRGHLGYIEHHCGDTLVHPEGGSTDPRDERYLVITETRDSAALFYFDEEAQKIIHYGGKYFWVNRNNANPGEGTLVKLHTHDNDATRFVFVPEDGSGSPYPAPELSGRWEVIFAVIDPISEHTYTVEYLIGKKLTKQTSEIMSWKVSANAAFEWFKSSAEYNYYACISESITWEYEISRTYSVTVSPGQTSVTWQWVFESERFGEIYRFRSNILGDTDDINRPPSPINERHSRAC